MTRNGGLTAETTARVLDRLAVPREPRSFGLADLTMLFRAWCRNVPFDNALRFLALREGSRQLLPPSSAEAFFRSWLADGCGGMCVPTAAALHSLLVTRGYAADIFDARLGEADVTDHLTTVVMLPRGRRYALEHGRPVGRTRATALGQVRCRARSPYGARGASRRELASDLAGTGLPVRHGLPSR